MTLTAEDWQAIRLTLALAATTTALLLALATPLAWWLARTRSPWKGPVAALVALPLVLPPTVLGFYLLILLGPVGPVGKLTQALGLGILPFTFSGLVVASVLASLPFAVQPLQQAFTALGEAPLEAAATLRAGPWDCFIHVVLPLARSGFLMAAVLSFAHTIGEFGVVLMMGGNIPGRTKVVSVQIYDHVQAFAYEQAHALSAVMLGLSFAVLLVLYGRGKSTPGR